MRTEIVTLGSDDICGINLKTSETVGWIWFMNTYSFNAHFLSQAAFLGSLKKKNFSQKNIFWFWKWLGVGVNVRLHISSSSVLRVIDSSHLLILKNSRDKNENSLGPHSPYLNTKTGQRRISYSITQSKQISLEGI